LDNHPHGFGKAKQGEHVFYEISNVAMVHLLEEKKLIA
jgi:hypothetical protein